MSANLIKLCTITLLNFLSIGLLIPVLTPHLLELGASYAVVGSSNAFRDIVNVLAGPVVGSWSDLKGTKYVVFVTLTIATICRLAIGLTTSLAVVFVLNTVMALFEHTPILSKTLICDVIPKEKQDLAYSTTGVMVAIGFIIGPVIGGYLSITENGFFYVCLANAVSNIIIIGITQTFPEKAVTKKEKKPAYPKNAFLNIFVELFEVDWKTFGDVFLLRFCLGFGVMSCFSNEMVYFHDEYNVSPKYVGFIIASIGVFGIIATISMSYIQFIFYKNDEKSSKFLLHQYIILAVSLILAYLIPNLNVLVAVLVIVSLVNTMSSLVTMNVLQKRGTDETRGSLTAVSESVITMGSSFGQLNSGLIASYFGKKSVFLTAHLSALLGVFICFNLNKEKNPTKKD
ncbi:hypothetical protein FQR65_LT13968 [Abscondita terminalis]|nr:hypothetical protein FQR65_LT13968 [Abscondita terminalis]